MKHGNGLLWRSLALILAIALLAAPAFGQARDLSGRITGSGNATNTATTSIIAAVPGVRRIYVTSAQCGRTDAGTTAIRVTLNDDASTVLVLPDSGGGGFVPVVFHNPLAVDATVGLTFTASAGVSTLYCNAQGFTGN